MLIDSVAFHFRHSFEDMSLRTRLLTNLAQTLVKTAKKHDIAVRTYISKMVSYISMFWKCSFHEKGVYVHKWK